MISRDNCIPFDDIAEIYDKTRFLPPKFHFQTFDEIIRRIARLKKSREHISFLEAGCGSGRLIIPFIEQLCFYLQGYKIVTPPAEEEITYTPFDNQELPPIAVEKYENQEDLGVFSNCDKLDFYCLDISSEMLKKFREKLKNSDWLLTEGKEDCFTKKIQKDNHDGWHINIHLIENDLRTYTPDDPNICFDVVFAHWIFHVIKDWHLALLNIYDLSSKNGLLFTFSENSELYDAIDRKLTKIKGDEDAKVFWENYFDLRAKIYAYYGVSIPPAKQRIGANVNDVNISHWVNKLYDSGEKEEQGIKKEDLWECKYVNRQILTNVIKKRAFSNMRLGKEETLEKIYIEIANKMENSGFSTIIDADFYSKTRFYANCYTRKNFQSEKKLNLLKEITKEVLSKKTPNDLFSIPHRAYRKYMEVLETISEKTSHFVGIHFFSHEEIKKNFRDDIQEFCFSKKATPPNLMTIWKNLTNYSDLEKGYYGIKLVEASSPVEEKHKEHLDISLSITIEGIKKIGLLIKRKDLTLKKIKKDFQHLYTSILEKKVCDSNPEHIKDFFKSIYDLCESQKICHYYFFPNLIYTSSGLCKSFGFMFWIENELTPDYKMVQNIKDLNDVIFGNIAQDFQTDFFVNVPVVVTSHNNTRIFGKLKEIRKEDACDILIATCTSSEFEQAIKLAGVPKNKKELRNIDWSSDFTTDTTSRLPQIYDISQESFGNRRVWIFQTFETGDGGHGISYSLKNILNYLKSTKKSHPKLIIMGGIAAGLKEDHGQIRGQILMASSVRKVTVENLETQEGSLQEVNEVIINTVKKCGEEYIKKTKSKTLYSQKIHLGPIISVNEVVNNYSLRSTIKKLDKKAIGLEMEGYGLAKVCNDEKNKIKWLLIKGISDFAHQKDEIEDYQKNIAKNTFDFIYYCLENENFNSLIEQLGSE